MSDDDADGTALYERISLQDFNAITQGFVQVVTAAGPANVSATARLVLVNQTVGAAITLNLPAAEDKIGDVKIVDWKGDAATNNITVVPHGSEKFQGGATSWKITGNKGSLLFSPASGLGYAV